MRGIITDCREGKYVRVEPEFGRYIGYYFKKEENKMLSRVHKFLRENSLSIILKAGRVLTCTVVTALIAISLVGIVKLTNMNYEIKVAKVAKYIYNHFNPLPECSDTEAIQNIRLKKQRARQGRATVIRGGNTTNGLDTREMK